MEKENKWIVVTGGSKGIGKAILEAFAKEGFNSITCSRNAADLEALRQEWDLNYPASAIRTMVCDLSILSECVKFTEFVLRETGKVTVLVNNAGYFLPGQIQNEPEGTLEKMMQTNVYSAYHVTRGLLPVMLAEKKGHIFSICSTASIMPYVNGGSYCMAKFALYGMTKVLREELKGTGIRVTAILPGATLTSSWDGVELPADRFMTPEDVGMAVAGCWKLSDHTVVEELLLRPQLGDI